MLSDLLTLLRDCTPQGVAPDLTEGQEYEFRIIAVNKAGQSEPSEPSDLIMARPRRREFYAENTPYHGW